jgi:ubiquitin carboxyl-terminal hydrolase L3
VFGLDPELLEMVPKPVRAVLLLFPITEETEAVKKAEDSASAGAAPANVWWTRQTVGNACGTVGLLHAVRGVGCRE